LDAAARIKKSEDQLRWMKRDLRKWFAKCTEVEYGIFEYILSIVTICVKTDIKK
jgi:hypothetical protein